MADVPDDLTGEVDKRRDFKRARPTGIAVPGPGQESVWDYPRPPRVELVQKKIKVEFAGVVVAETRRAYRVLETASPPVYYLSPDGLRTEYLEPSHRSSLCEWKGMARYWSLRVGSQFAQNAAWSYPDPWSGFEVIKDYLAFYPRKMDACYVGEHRAIPQPGEFYGG